MQKRFLPMAAIAVLCAVGALSACSSDPGAVPATGVGVNPTPRSPVASAAPASASAGATATAPAAPGQSGASPVSPGASGGGSASGTGASGGAPTFLSSSIDKTVTCSTPGETQNAPPIDSPNVALAWRGSGATSAFVGVDTADAQAEPYSSVAVSGSTLIPYPCPRQSQVYTITLVNAAGATSVSVTVLNEGYRG